LTHFATRGKVFDKSGQGKTGYLKNGAHVDNGRLVLDGVDNYVLVPCPESPNGFFDLDYFKIRVVYSTLSKEWRDTL